MRKEVAMLIDTKKLAQFGLPFLVFFMWLTMPINQAAAENPDTLRPTKTYVVNDYANLLTQTSKSHIINQEKHFQATKERPQVVVLTVKSTDGMDMKSFTNQLTLQARWQAGKKGQDNGVLIVFAENNGQNNVRVVTGTGVESVLPDGKITQLLEDNRDNLKSNDSSKVNQGLMNLFDEICQVLPTQAASSTKKPGKTGLSWKWLLLIVILLPLVLITGLSRFTRANRQDRTRSTNRGGGSSWWQWLLLSALLNSGSNHHHDSWSDSDNGDWSGSSDDFTDSGGGGDFGGGGSDY